MVNFNRETTALKKELNQNAGNESHDNKECLGEFHQQTQTDEAETVNLKVGQYK